MQIHIKSKSRRPNKWPSSCSMLKIGSISLMLLILVGGSAEALAKQQQQRSDDSQQASSVIGGHQSQQQYSHHQPSPSSSAYQNHQQSSGSSGAQPNSASAPTSSYSSSVLISSASGGSAQNSQSASPRGEPSGSVAVSQQASGRNGVDQMSAYSNYGSPSASSSPSSSSLSASSKQQGLSSYGDNSALSANAPDQSYQAAANSVNMALANSGIFGAGSSSGGSSVSYTPSGASGNQAGGSNSAVQSLNPLHYFYYPSKDSGKAASGGASGIDMMSNAASNNYQSMAAYPTYADQLNSALSSIGSGPDVAASSQDPSYLPQPSAGGSMGADMGGQQGAYGSQQQSGGQQAPGQQHSSPFPDLSAYSSNMNAAPQQQQQHPQSQQPSSSSNGISFNGPSNSGQPSGDMFGMGAGSSQGMHNQQVPSMSAYQASSLYNQMGDLSTSNFGNNAGGLSSVASYMSPSQQAGSQHDLFSSLAGNGGQQFNSAASSLSPAAVSPPGLQQQQQQVGSSSLFGSSLFGGQQSNPSASAGANQLFSNQHYLNSFISPQQYSQLTGQQVADPSGQMAAAASNPAATSAVASASTGSSKRFGIGSFIMPMLALAGLSLLIPTMSNIGTAVGRKKRSIEDKASSSARQQQIAFDPINGASQLAKEMSIGEYMDKIERYYSIYKNAVENEECLNRLICEFGDAVKDITGKTAVVTVIEKLVPTWMTGKVHLFKDAALDNKEGKEKCKNLSDQMIQYSRASAS